MKILLALVCILTTASVRAEPQPAAAQAADWKFSTSVNFDTGRYGSEDRTNSVYIPFTLKRYLTNADLSVTVPYLRQSSSGQVAWVGGKPVRVTKGRVSVATSSNSGLGDIILHGTFGLKRDGPGSFDLGLAGKLKLPTADEKKGLGTGKMDVGTGLEFAKEFSPGWTLLADGYYTIIGEPAGVNFNNQVSLDLGIYRLLSERVSLTVSYETQNSIVSGNPGPRSISGTLAYNVPDGVQLFGGAALGLSDGSPEIGVSGGFSQRF
ncbi:MAG: transporter [Elusimicrobiales bacterium]|nr:transporter [Elusimicrobiales bacterium]